MLLLGLRYVKKLLCPYTPHADKLYFRHQAPLASADAMLIDGTLISPVTIPPHIYEPGSGRADLAA